MPNMNGVELSRRIKQINKDQVIIVLSGYIDTFVIELIDIGIASLIMKPFKTNHILNVMLKQCENIVLKKEFEKIKLSQLGTKLSQKESSSTKTHFQKLAQEVVDMKTTDETLQSISKNFSNVDEKILKHLSIDI